MTNVTLALRGIRGESAADIARRVLSITGSDKAALQALMLDDAELAQILTDAEAARDGAEADAVQTALDRIATAADRVQTGLDRVATAADVVAAEADRVATAADRVATAADRVQTGLDRTQTGLDRVATAADRVQTGLDRVATAADVAAADADRVATAADRVQTGLDRVATTADRAATAADVLLADADRVQTGLDRVATAADVVSSAANAAAVAGAVDTFARFSRADLYSLTDDTRRNLFMHSGIELLFASGYYRSGLAAPAAFLSLPGATYTRAGAATAETAAGVIVNFAANVPRITDRGVLIEEARTNLLLGSTLQGGVNQPTWWDAGTNTGTSRGPVTSTRGAPGAWQASATNGREFFSQVVTLAANTTYTVSVFVESVSGDTAVLSYATDLPAGATTGSIISPSTPGLYTYKIVVAATAGTAQIRLGLGCSSNNSGAGTVRFSSAQLEPGAFPTSYIPTTGAAATRAADVMLLSSATSGARSLVAIGEYAGAGSDVSANNRVLAGMRGTGNNQIILYNRLGGTGAYIETATVGEAFPSIAGTVAPGVVFESAISVAANDVRFAKDAVLGAPDTSAAIPATTSLGVGCLPTGSFLLNGYVRSIVYFPFTLNDNQLQVQSNLPSAPALSEALTTDATLDLMARASLYGVTDISQALGFARTGVEAIFTTPYYRKGLLSSVSPNAVSLTFSRTGAGTALDVAGNVVSFATGEMRRTDRGVLVEEARTNLLLNSATLSTQNVTVAAAAHTLSFYGTGTVTLTGVSTAGPLVGTGAGNRVTLTFTPTAGTLTLTVSGSVTSAQLEAGATPSSYIPTGAAAATRAADTLQTAVSITDSQDFVIYAAASLSGTSPVDQRLFTLDAGGNANRLFVSRTAAGLVGASITVASSVTLTATTSKTGARTLKVAIRRVGTAYTLFVDGVALAASTVASMPTLTAMFDGHGRANIAPLNDYLRSRATMLGTFTDAQCIAMTT